MKKYSRLKCTKCLRETDKLTNTTHFVPDLCTITLGCIGRLQIKQYLSNANIAQVTQFGIADWVARGSAEITPIVVKQPELVSAECGALGEIVIASDVNTPRLTVIFEGKVAAPKAYRAFMYRLDGVFKTVSGVESGLEKKTLRFSTADTIEVYVNGILRNAGTGPDDYQTSNTSSVQPNTIVFNNEVNIQGIIQIDVIVSKAVPSTEYLVEFTRNIQDESKPISGWSNVNSVSTMFDGNNISTKYLYTVNLNSINIPANTLLKPKSSSNIMLLARKPYSQVDRYTTLYIDFKNFNNDNQYLKYSADINSQNIATSVKLQVMDTSIQSVYPPMVLNLFQPESLIPTEILGDVDQITIDGSTIIGPDE